MLISRSLVCASISLKNSEGFSGQFEKSLIMLITFTGYTLSSCSTWLSFSGFLAIETILKPYFAKTLANPKPISSVEPVINAQDPTPYLLRSRFAHIALRK